TVDLSPLEAVWFAENQDKLNRLGYETVALNDKTIAIKTSPTNIGFDKVRENFMNSLSALGNKETAPVVINVADDELFADQSSNIGKSQSDWTYDLDYRQEGYAKNVWNRAGDKTGAEYLVAVVQNGTYVDLKELGLSQEIQKEIYLSELNHRADDLVTLVEVNHDNPGTVFAALNKTTGELIHVRNEDLKPGDYNNVIYKSTLSQITRISSLTEELKDGIKNFAAENPALYKEVKALPTKVYDIGAGSMGNGTTIWNRADEENRDYKRIAHIGETGVISIYEQGMPEAAMLDIYSRAFSNAGEKEVLVPFNHENEKVAFAVVNKETGEVFSIGKNFEGKENQQIVVKNNFATVVKNYDGLATELKAGVDRLKTDDYQLYSKLNRTGSADGKLEQFAKMLQKDYPNLGFSYGYIGNVGTNYDDRSFKIFSRIPALGAVGQNASYGGFSKPEGLYEDVFERQGRFDRWLQNLAAKSELVTLEVKAELDSIIKTLDKPAERFLSGESKPQVIGEQESYNLARIEATGAIPGRIDRLEAAGYRIKFGEAAETIKDILVGKLSGNYADRFLEKGLTIEPIAFNKIERQEFISRSDLAANRDKIYLFGDNLRQAGFGGQAKEMRGEPNAFGIPTKMNPSNEPSAFFSDENIIDNKIAINEAFGKLARYAPDTVIVIPTAGLGTGLADLESRAPQTFAFLQEKLAKLEANASFTVEETQIEAVNRLKDEYTQLGANLREYFSNEKVTNIHSDVIAEINESGEIEARLHLFTDDPNNANSQNYFGKIEAEAGKSYVLSYGDIAETYTQISSIGDAIVIELMHRADEERADHEAVAAIENAPPTVYVGSTQETVQMQMSILAAVPVRERELEINNPLEAINLYEAGAIISKGVTGYSDTHGGGMDADWEEAQIARLVINGASENQVVSLIKQFEDVTQDVAIIVDGRDYQLSVTNNSFVENVLAVYQSDLLDDTAENEAEEAYELEEEEAYELEEDIDYGAFVLDEDEEIEAVGWIQLNEKELAVFASAAQEIVDNSGGQFGFLSNAKTPDEMTRAEFAGYTGSLVSKGLITVEEERKQVQMTAEGAK
ncbi:MAG TPA: hypothetical protein VK308_15870, partial [Pyrinomonadaceae bacterium]|nr:hypothetical protein [Pyrinomonadaceae bacterium]